MTMKQEILYFERGWADATSLEESYQCVGIHPITLEIIDKEELIFLGDIPDLSYGIDNLNDVIHRFNSKGWELV